MFSKMMQSVNYASECASACAAAASFTCADCASFHMLSMDAALLASIIIMSLLALGLRILGVLVILVVLLRIILCELKLPKSRV